MTSTIDELRAAIARIESGEGEGGSDSQTTDAAPRRQSSPRWLERPGKADSSDPASASPDTCDSAASSPHIASRPRAAKTSRAAAAREKALSERGLSVTDTGRRARTVRLVRVSCDSCGYERVVPKPVADAASWPERPDSAAIDDALAAAQRSATMLRVQTLVSQRDYATEEMRARLVQEGFDQDAVDESIERAKDYSWLDDRRFAQQLVSNKLAAGWGAIRISRELRHRGVPDTIAETALERTADGDGEVERAIAILEHGRSVRPPHARDKLYRKLASRGFPSSTCSAAVSRFLDSHPEVTPW